MRLFILLLVCLFVSLGIYAQVRTTVQPGAWNSGATWSGGVVPTSANSTSIVVAHDVNVPNGFSVTIDQTTINQNITLTVDNGGTVTVADDGTGAADLALFNDGINFGFLVVSGRVNCNNNATFSGTGSNVDFLNLSTYEHRYTTTEGAVPLADWDPGSTVEVTGFTSSITATAGGNWSQSFGNFTYNCPGQTFFSLVDFAGNLTTVNGDLRIVATNAGAASQGGVVFSSGQNPTITIGGNFTIEGTARSYFSNAGATTNVSIGGDFIISSTNTKGYGGTTLGTVVIDVAGNFNYNALGGKFYLANGSGSGTLLLDGDFINPAGGFLGNGDLQFTGGAQSFSTGTPFPGHVDYTIAASSTLDLGTNVLGGGGTFDLYGTIRVGSTEPTGAIASSTALGNIRVPVGFRTYQAGSRIVYASSAAQFIGTGHPVTPGIDLEIDNSNVNGVSLVSSITVGGNLVLTQGPLKVDGQSLTLVGDVSVASGFVDVTASSRITVNGSGALGNFPFAPGATTLLNFSLNRTAGSVTFVNDVTIAGVLTLTSGNLVFSNHNLTLTGTLSRTSGFFSGNSSSTLNIGGTGALGSNISFVGGGNTINTLNINRPGTGNVSTSGAFIVTTAVNLTNGGLVNTGTITLSDGATVTRGAGSLSTNRFSAAATDSYNLLYTGGGYSTGLELPDPADNVDLNNLTFNGGVVTSSQNFTVNGTVLFLAGSFQCGLRTITMEGPNWTVNGGSFVPGTGAVIFNGNTTLGGSGTLSFNVFTVNNGASVTMPVGNVNISSNFTLNASSAFSNSGGTITFNGTSGQSVSAGGKTLANLSVNKSGGSVTFVSLANLSGILTIQTATTVNANGNLTLLSTTDGPTGNASIGPIPAGATVSGNVTYQRYMSDEGVINRYISFPIRNMPVSQVQDDFSVTGKFSGTSYPCTGCTVNGASIRYYDESLTGGFENGYQGFPRVSNSEQFVTGRGYLAYMYEASPLNPKTVLMDLTGNIVQGTFDYSTPVDLITRTNSGQPQFDDDDGWNLIGNPYPATIAWSNSGAAWTKTDIAPTIYVTDNPAGVFRSYNANTMVGDLTNGLIASGQAFWVYANTSTATLTVHEPAKSANTGTFFRRAPTPSMTISLSHNGVVDNSYLVIYPDATESFDPLYDATKPRNPVFDIALTRKGESRRYGMFAINRLPEEVEIPLSLRTKEPGEFIIRFANYNSLPGSPELYLIDNELGKSMLVAENASYPFAISDLGSATDRFTISSHPAAEKAMSPLAAGMVHVFPNPVNDLLSIRIESDDVQGLGLLNVTGTMVAQPILSFEGGRASGEVKMHDLPSGVYFVRVQVEGNLVVRKIIRN